MTRTLVTVLLQLDRHDRLDRRLPKLRPPRPGPRHQRPAEALVAFAAGPISSARLIGQLERWASAVIRSPARPPAAPARGGGRGRARVARARRPRCTRRSRRPGA